MAQASTPSTWEVVAERTRFKASPCQTVNSQTRQNIQQQTSQTKAGHDVRLKPQHLGGKGRGVAAPDQPGLCSEETRLAML